MHTSAHTSDNTFYQTINARVRQNNQEWTTATRSPGHHPLRSGYDQEQPQL